jgi:hypothetical protein
VYNPFRQDYKQRNQLAEISVPPLAFPYILRLPNFLFFPFFLQSSPQPLYLSFNPLASPTQYPPLPARPAESQALVALNSPNLS